MKSQRSAAFDVAKGIAMYLVVLGHLIADRTADPAYLINFLHLPVLFFISGFFSVSSVEKRTAGELLKRKAVALLIPFLIWSGISLGANSALMILRGGFTLQNVLNEAVQIFVYARSVWFLLQLFLTFAVFLAIYKLVNKLKLTKFALLGFLAAWLALSLLIPGDLLAFHKFKWLFPFFLTGYYVGRQREKLTQWLESHKHLTMLGWVSLLYPALVVVLVGEEASLQYTTFSYATFSGVLSGGLYYGISALGVVLVMMVSRWIANSAVGKLIAQLGIYSLDIYVIHMFLIKFVPIPVDLQALNPVLAYVLLSVITLCVVTAICLIAKWVLHRIKIYRICVGSR